MNPGVEISDESNIEITIPGDEIPISGDEIPISGFFIQ